MSADGSGTDSGLVLLSAVFFMRKVGKTIAVTEVETPEDGVLRYRVTGQLLFDSADLFAASLEHHGHPRRVEIDMTDAHLWGLIGVAWTRSCSATAARARRSS